MQARWYETMIKRLQGKVTLDDIKANLAVLVNAINDTVENLNTLAGISDRDFTVGSTNIPSEKYTLTLGALNKIREAYKGLYLNKTCVDDPLNPGKIITFPNIYFNDSTFDRINQAVLECPNKDAFDIYYDKENKELCLYNTLDSDFAEVGYTVTSSNMFWYVQNMRLSPISVVGDTCTLSFEPRVDDSSSLTFLEQDTNEQRYLRMKPEMTISSDTDLGVTGYRVYYGKIKNREVKTIYCDIAYQDNEVVFYYYDYYTHEYLPDENDFIPVDSKTVKANKNLYLSRFAMHPTNNYKLTVKSDKDVYYKEQGTPENPIIDENCVEWTPIDWHRDEWVLNTTEDNLYVNPDKSPVIKVTPVQYAMGAIPLNENTGNMLIPDARVYGDWNDNSVTIDGVTIQRMQEGAMNKGFSYVNVWTPIWIPPGLNDKVTNFVNSKGIAYTINIGDNS